MSNSTQNPRELFERLERVIQQGKVQSQLSELLRTYKANNGAIKHLAVFGMDGTLLAHCPDEEVQNTKLLEAQYAWLADIIGPSIASMSQARHRFAQNNKKRVPKDFGCPTVLRLQTEGGEAVSQIYASAIEQNSIIFLVISARAATRRKAIVVNEGVLLEDLEKLIEEILSIEEIKASQ